MRHCSHCSRRGLGEAFHPLVGILDRLTVFIESDLLGWMIKLDRGQVSLVRERPGALAVVGAAMAQQQGFQLQARPQTRATGILFDGPVSRCLGTLNPSGSVHAARRSQQRNPRYGRQASSSNLQLRLASNRGPGHDV
jgi:hypothetical protein